MMKVLLLFALVPAIIHIVGAGKNGTKPASSCHECGGRCTETCPGGEVELPQATEDRHCWADKNICCIPYLEQDCYAAGGACLTQSACNMAGQEMADTNGFCTTVRDNPRICCAVANDSLVCPAPEPSCPSGWRVYEDTCYKFAADQSMNRDEAITYCGNAAQGAILAVLDTRVKMDWATGIVKDHFGTSPDLWERFWVAGQYDATADKYYFDDANENEIVKVSNLWMPGEPNHYGDEKTINFWVKSTVSGLNDAYGYKDFRPFCMVNLA